MNARNDVIENPVTGQAIIFEPPDGRDADRFEARFRAGGFAGPPHVHPRQQERFEVLAGRAGFRLGSRELELRAGRSLTIAAGEAHTYWNAGEGELRIINEFTPALACTRGFYEFYFGMARAGRAGKDGLPNLWQIALNAEAFADHVRLAKPSWMVQRLLFAVLRPGARLLGYRRGVPGASARTASRGGHAAG